MLQPARQLLDSGNYASAATAFQQLLDINNNIVDAHVGLCMSKTMLGQKQDALPVLLKALELRPDDASRRLLLWFLNSPGSLEYNPGIAEELRNCLPIPQFSRPAGRCAEAEIRKKYKLDQDGTHPKASSTELSQPWLTDPLFLDVLSKSIISDCTIEYALVSIRKKLLLSRNEIELDEKNIRNICISLAEQCFNNGYVFYESNKEKASLAVLEREISTPAETDNRLLIWTLYRPLFNHPLGPELAAIPVSRWGTDLENLVEKTLYRKTTEKYHQGNIPVLGVPGNSVSRTVQKQYEEFAYPQWSHSGGTVSDTRQRLASVNPGFQAPDYLNAKLDILIAGAGTCQHPVQVAMSNQQARVTAFDLSSTSLAYGVRMADELGISNISFLQGDILDIEKTGKTFDVIECTGVLHHMERPVDGWKKLTRVLRDDGLMKIALYSETARRKFLPIWEDIRKSGLTGSADEIRKFRYDIIQAMVESNGHAMSDIMKIADSHTLSGCKDFLFNVQELRFTIPQIQSALALLGLTFIGMEGPAPLHALAMLISQGQIPANSSAQDLDTWDQVEKLAPDTFIHMYQFWCIKT